MFNLLYFCTASLLAFHGFFVVFPVALCATNPVITWACVMQVLCAQIFYG